LKAKKHRAPNAHGILDALFANKSLRPDERKSKWTKHIEGWLNEKSDARYATGMLRFVKKVAASEVVNANEKGEDEDGGNVALIEDMTLKGRINPATHVLSPGALMMFDVIRTVPIDHQEDIYLMRYGFGGEYRPHVDYFVSTNRDELRYGGQRHATVIFYLNTLHSDDAESGDAGGQTLFTAINLRVTPCQGDALLFYNALPGGTVDHRSRHAGLPLTSHRPKWIASIWIRERIRNQSI
jgi:2OG-Fe(II) oxygenase superfamily